jgi:flavin-dependent dehydrogenase
VRITADQGLEAYDGPVGPHDRLIALLCTHHRMKEFAGRLNQRYREVVAGLRPLAGVPLDTAVAVGPFNYRASTVARGGAFLVGDASGFVDPISGEGLATGMQQGLAFSLAIRQPDPESAYRRRHRELTAGPRRATTLLVHLAASSRRADRAVRGMQRVPGVMPKLLGMTLGYWGAGRLTPRDWLALLTGR